MQITVTVMLVIVAAGSALSSRRTPKRRQR